MVEILDEEILYEQGSFRRVKRYLKGSHPELGKLVRGLTGWETLVEVDVVVPMGIFEVHEQSK